MVSWSQGEVRHNVWYSKDNTEASGNRKRAMYVIGKALDLEHSLRGLAKATAAGVYADAMIKRVNAAKADVGKIVAVAKTPEIAAIAAAAGSAELKVNNAAQLNGAADKISAAAMKLSASQDGSGLAGVDSMIPAAGSYKGKAAQ